jgi:hypothetical protein
MVSSHNKPIINCHTHIFKGEHVPPYLAKAFVPWPLYKILSIPFILWIFKRFVTKKNKKYKDPYIERERNKVKKRIKIQRNILLKTVIMVLKTAITIQAVFIICKWLELNTNNNLIYKVEQWLTEHYLLIPLDNLALDILIVAIVVLFVKSGRNLLWFIAKKSIKLLSLLPGKMTRDLIDRYLLLGRFTIYKDQSTTFSKLVQQYDEGTKFIVLPMDMEYMGAGKLKKGFEYKDQMQELADIKNKSTNKDAILPFVFVEPRRIREDKTQLQYSLDANTGKVTLQDCFIKRYIEDEQFSGFKIYPALGYYVFDETLLPLWKYAADNQIPIMTHCIKGTIFYRGKKEKKWDEHPVFKEYINLEKNELGPLLLPEHKNMDFSLNFTHPLNYLVLLKEELLRVWVGKCSQDTKDLFGYTNTDTKLKWDLSHLKLCLAHFGGEDQWYKYLESDRYDYAAKLKTNPLQGVNFIHTSTGKFSWKKLEDCWKYVDWYSIICSMMLQHKNVYADISYILYNEDIFPLLKETINHPNLGDKVLFGTDFFVVRNHASEKGLVSRTLSNLSDDEFNKIARENPSKFI